MKSLPRPNECVMVLEKTLSNNSLNGLSAEVGLSLNDVTLLTQWNKDKIPVSVVDTVQC